MENLHRRASGIYVTRLAVPAHLRHIVGKREYVATTGTHHLAVAKLVAATMLATWRQQLLDLERIALGNAQMSHDSIVKIVDGHPLLAGDSHLPVDQGAAVLGLSVADILRSASEGRVGLFHRVAATRGYLVLIAALERDDPELGTLMIPQPSQMPDSAVAQIASGVLAVPSDSVRAVADGLLVTGEAIVVMFAAPDSDSSRGFVPDEHVTLTLSNIEVSTRDLQRLRVKMAGSIEPARIAAARETMRAAVHVAAATGKYAHRLMSEALEAYAKNFLPQKITSPNEIERVRSGIALFIEFEGDLALGDIDAERLRSFRDEKLSRVLANENKVRLRYRTNSMTESIAAVNGVGWPVMSAAELRPPQCQAPHLYKDSPLGGIPMEWDLVAAASRCSVITKGTTPAADDMWQGDEGVRFLRVDNLSFDGKFNFEASKFRVSTTTHRTALRRSMCLPGDVLTNIVGPPLGKLGLVTGESGEININQAIALFRPNGDLLQRFLLLWLGSVIAQSWLRQRAKQTSGQVNLTLAVCQELPIPHVDATEQQAITVRNDAAQERIDVESRELAKLVELKSGLMDDLLTGRVRVTPLLKH